jgi:hypothetical protein
MWLPFLLLSAAEAQQGTSNVLKPGSSLTPKTNVVFHLPVDMPLDSTSKATVMLSAFFLLGFHRRQLFGLPTETALHFLLTLNWFSQLMDDWFCNRHKARRHSSTFLQKVPAQHRCLTPATLFSMALLIRHYGRVSITQPTPFYQLKILPRDKCCLPVFQNLTRQGANFFS